MSKKQQSTQPKNSFPKYVRFSDDVTCHEPAIVDYRYENYYYSESDYTKFRKANKHIVSVMNTCASFTLAPTAIEKITGDSIRGLEISCRCGITRKMDCKDLSIQAVLHEQEMQRNHGTAGDASATIAIIYQQACEKSKMIAINYGIQDERDAFGGRIGNGPQIAIGTDTTRRRRRPKKIACAAA